MSQATVRFDLGAESVTVPLDIDLPTSAPLSGDVSGTFGDCFVAGDLNLTGDLFIEGVMTGIDTFRLQGNGFTVFFQNGGRADLHGKFKAPWGPWGTDSTGWLPADRLAVSPTKKGAFVPSELAWSDWSMARPTNSLDVTLVDGRIAKPEVLNLSQSIVIENLSRGFHFHDSAGIQRISDVKFLNCGSPGIGNYPVHFHKLYDNSRGSVLERVVVEGGKNHAFVPHGSHGISFPGCAAYNTKGVAFWWDRPLEADGGHAVNDSHDINWDGCLSMLSSSSTAQGENARLAGFWLGAGKNLSCRGAVATCVPGNPNGGSRTRSGFHWPEQASDEPWDVRDCLAHNNAENGIFTWQNNIIIVNPVDDFVAYHNGYTGINHGAYRNRYQYHRAVLTGHQLSVIMHAKTPEDGGETLLFEDVLSDGPLSVPFHNSASVQRSIHRRCTYTQVIYTEVTDVSYVIFEDCGLTSADFVLTSIPLGSIIEIFEAGILTHRWQSGVWS